MSPPTRPEALAVEKPNWDEVDIRGWRDYLAKNGKRFLAYVASRAPKIDTDSTEKCALTGAKHAGYEALFEVLSSMADDAIVSDNVPFIEND